MLESQKFKTVVFGGFDREHVVRYITNMVSRFNSDVDLLKKSYESQIQQKDSEILEYKAKCKIFYAEIKNLRDEMLQRNREFEEEILEKIELIDFKDQVICQMNKKLQGLESQLSAFREENKKIENNIKYAEMVAKQRVKKIIQKAKLKVQQEYRENLALAERENGCLRKKAREEASKILKNAANRAYEFTDDSKKEARRMVEISQKKADEILCATKLVVENMLKNGAQAVVDDAGLGELEKISVDFDVDFLKNKINEEVEAALKQLNKECDETEASS